jgi:adenylate cyclase
MPIDPQRFRPEPQFTAPQLAAEAGLDVDFGKRVMRALGLPNVADDEVEFDERDVEVAKILRFLLDQGYAERDILTVARTYGYALSRVAFAEVRLFSQTFVDPLVQKGLSADELDDRLEAVVPQLLELLDVQIRTIHRRHLAVALQQVSASKRAGRTELLAAGFADLVGFSRLSNDIEGDDLEDLIAQFETMVVERCVDAGAQVVKVLGDAVMFVASSSDAALAAATAVVDGAGATADLPEARAGLDFGEVRALGGDYFGRPINVAARLTGFARPGTVVVSEELMGSLQRDAETSHIGRTRLKGVGTVRAYKARSALSEQDGTRGVGSRLVSQHDGSEDRADLAIGGNTMASKDKGGKSEKKEAKKSLKEKRATKKDKKTSK